MLGLCPSLCQWGGQERAAPGLGICKRTLWCIIKDSVAHTASLSFIECFLQDLPSKGFTNRLVRSGMSMYVFVW